MLINEEVAAELPAEVLELIRKQAVMIELFEKEIRQLKEQVEWLKRQLFGRRSERAECNPNQLKFDSILIEAIENRPAAEDTPAAVEQRVAAHVRKVTPHGRGILPDHLEREIVEIDIPEEQKILADGRERPCIGYDESEKLAWEAPRFYVKVIRRLKYGSLVGAEDKGVVEAPVPDVLLPKCLADDTLLAHVAVSKYGDHLPAYRLENIFKRSGIHISRQTFCGWMQALGIALTPLVGEIRRTLFETGLVHSDDTPVDLLEADERRGDGKRIRKARLWVASAGPRDGPWTVFDFTVTREAEGPRQFFADYSGKIVCDAYSGYGALAESNPKEENKGIVLYGCWAHVRRYFFNACKGDDPKHGSEFIAMIRMLYDIEEGIKNGSNKEILYERQSRSRSVLDSIRKRIDELLPVTTPKSALGKALNYTSNYWDRLVRFADDPQAAIDNNTAENAIRPVALGRKNWLFIGNRRSGEAAANIMSVIATCKRAGLEPYAYLLDVIRRLPSMKISELATLLPPQWKNQTPLPTP